MVSREEPLVISVVIAEMVAEHLEGLRSSGRTVRLVIPGLTERIAREIHSRLVESGIHSYLVIGDDQEPDEDLSLIRPLGLTSKRIGSFVAVTAPGELAHVHDSIRGSGGAIRSPAFSEEWPWVDDGKEAFRFQGPGIERLMDSWGISGECRDWIREFVVNELVDATRPLPSRGHLLLERFLGTFDPTSCDEIEDVRECLLFHTGVPRDSRDTSLADARSLARDRDRDCTDIVKRWNGGDYTRDYILGTRVKEIAEDSQQEDAIRSALEHFLDALGSSKLTDSQFLAFSECWGHDEQAIDRWRILTIDRLKSLFDLRSLRDQVHLSYQVVSGPVLADEEGREAVVHSGTPLCLSVDYRVQNAGEIPDQLELVVLHRNKPLEAIALDEAGGTVPISLDTRQFSGRFRSRIPIRIVCRVNNNVYADERLGIHLVDHRRAAMVVIPDAGFRVVDAEEEDEDGERAEEKVEVDTPVHLFLVSHSESLPQVCDGAGNEINLVPVNGLDRVWRSSERLAPNVVPTGQIICDCTFGSRVLTLSLEASDVDDGEFTLQDELASQLARNVRTRVNDIVQRYSGEVRDPYPRLGNLDDAARYRGFISIAMQEDDGWKPLLMNMLGSREEQIDTVGKYLRAVGNVDPRRFFDISLPSEAEDLLGKYASRRQHWLRLVREHQRENDISTGHPLYAVDPVFVDGAYDEREPALRAYLESYVDIMEYLDREESIGWPQAFCLHYVDCLVHWSDNGLGGALVLLGPWHPLVLSTRFMVSAALYQRAIKARDDGGRDHFPSLVNLLRNIPGFRWIRGLASSGTSPAPLYASPTSDPGWHLAYKADVMHHTTLESIGLQLEHSLGLSTGVRVTNTRDLVPSCINAYIRAHPSRRMLSMEVSSGYSPEEVVASATGFLHGCHDNSYGAALEGGIRLWFNERPDILPEDAQWLKPPLLVHDRNRCRRDHLEDLRPDIYLASPSIGLDANDLDREPKPVPRGVGLQAVFHEPILRLVQGQDQLPRSMATELEPNLSRDRRDVQCLGEAYKFALGVVREQLGGNLAVGRKLDLPRDEGASWVVLPGEDIDPGMLVEYARLSRDSEDQPGRVVWDYSVDLAGRGGSYYIISRIPRGFPTVVNGIFGDTEFAVGMINDLGRIGIAIGGESLRSGRHALGVIGLVGAARMLLRTGVDSSREQDDIIFVVPVDSFGSFFGAYEHQGRNLRADLLYVRIGMRGEAGVAISACAVESKFVSGTFSQSASSDALRQARSSIEAFRSLLDLAKSDSSMPERLALLRLLRFGLRASSPGPDSVDASGWEQKESVVYDAVLNGRFRHEPLEIETLLVSTEKGLRGGPELEPRKTWEGAWLRLNIDHWPGVSETDNLARVATGLRNLLRPRDSTRGQFASDEGGVKKEAFAGDQRSAFTGEVADHDTVSDSADHDTLCEKPDSGVTEPLTPILLGTSLGRHPIFWDPHGAKHSLNNNNLMITGSSGTGKTQFLKYLICRLRDQRKNVLILDLKNDFADDRVFMDKASLPSAYVAFDGLPYNPLIPYPIRHPASGKAYIQCSQHISGICDVLRETYGLGMQQQRAVKSAITACFRRRGIPIETMPYEESMQFPDFAEVGEELLQDNELAFNRLDPLFTLGLFKEEYKDVSFHSLADRSIILDLSQIPSNEIKNALAQIIVMSAHAYFNSQGQSGGLRQALVFDEAHRVLNSKYMPLLVRECRAYGVATILSSQYPSDFPRDLADSMATKVLHSNGRDSNRVKEIVRTVGFQGDESSIADLEMFEALVDNDHNRNTLVRTMHYPLYLLYEHLLSVGGITGTRGVDLEVDGVDPAKMPLDRLVHQLELMGLAISDEQGVRLLGALE